MSAGLLGGAMAPFIVNLGELVGFNAMSICGLVTVPGIFLTLLFRETKGQLLQDEIKELILNNKV